MVTNLRSDGRKYLELSLAPWDVIIFSDWPFDPSVAIVVLSGAIVDPSLAFVGPPLDLVDSSYWFDSCNTANLTWYLAHFRNEP